MGPNQTVTTKTPEDVKDLVELFGKRPRDGAELKTHIEDGIAMVRKVFSDFAGVGKPVDPPAMPPYDVLAPATAEVYVLVMRSGRVWDRWDSVLQQLGRSLRHARTREKPSRGGRPGNRVSLDQEAVRSALMSRRPGDEADSPEVLVTPALGLPVQFQFPHARPSMAATVQAEFTESHERISRRASPVWLRAVRTQDGQYVGYVGVVTIFRGAFLPATTDYRLTLVERQNAVPRRFQLDDRSQIDAFVRTLKDDYAVTCVAL